MFHLCVQSEVGVRCVVADLVIWSKNPFSVYALTEYVFVDGAKAFVRGEKELQPVTDFDLGIINPSDERASL